MSLACTALYASVVSLWIWTLVAMNKQSTVVPAAINTHMANIENTTNMTTVTTAATGECTADEVFFDYFVIMYVITLKG